MTHADVLDEAEPESGSARCAVAGFIHPVKPFKHACLLVRGDTDSLVGHDDVHVCVSGGDPNANLLIFVRLLNRGLEKVFHGYGQELPVPHDEDVVGELGVDVDRFRLGDDNRAFESLTDDGTDIDGTGA